MKDERSKQSERRRQVVRNTGSGKKRRRNTATTLSKISTLLVICFVIMCICNATSCWASNNKITVYFEIDSYEIKQGDASPIFEAEAFSDTDPGAYISRDSDYTLGKLLTDLNNRELVPLSSGTDGSVEGKYPINPTIPQDILELLAGEKEENVELVFEKGFLTVLNKFGKWEGDTFLGHDGTLITNSFIESKGTRFYINGEGNMQKGFFSVDGIPYHCGNDGRMTVGWFDDNGGRYFANEDGSLLLGWMNEEASRFYFDENGRAVTGEMTIGASKCTFDENGVLVSEEPLFRSDKPLVALTFDDGPGPRTLEIVNKLAEYNARATFFMLGDKINENNYSVLKAMEDAGCELASHSYSHPWLTKLGAEGVKEQMAKTDAKIIAAVGYPAALMRPPYGSIDETVRANVGKPAIMWSIDTLDWQHKKVEETIRVSMTQVKDGSIILIHDIHSTSVDATLELIPKLIDAGYQLVTVSELAQARGIVLENGEKYFSIP